MYSRARGGKESRGNVEGNGVARQERTNVQILSLFCQLDDGMAVANFDGDDSDESRRGKEAWLRDTRV